MKEYSEEQVSAMVRLRYGRQVDSPNNTAFATYKTLGEIFGCSSSQIRKLCFERFEKLRVEKLSFLK